MRSIFLIVIITFIFIGCVEQTSVPLSFTPNEKWRSYNIHNYTIEQIRSCYCINGGQRMRITVRSDSIYLVMRISDSTLIIYPDYKYYLTINSLFGIIQNSKSDSLIVTYDSKYGYPNKLDINPQLHPLDGGVMYVTSNLQITK
jgi:hypothetical protein